MFDAAGDVVTEFGGLGRNLGKLSAPAQMALDAAGNLWVADRGNNRVQQFGPNGERLLTFGERGIGPGQFINPSGVSVDCRGTLTVTDTENNRVQQFALLAPPAAPCATLEPLGHPPAPRLPTLPLPLGPQVTVRPLRSSGLFTTRALPLRVGCDTVCTLTATGTLTERGKPRRRKRAVSVTLRAARTKVPAGESKIVRLTLSRAQVARLRKAMKRRRGLTVTLQIVATAAAGEPTVISRRLDRTRLSSGHGVVHDGHMNARRLTLLIASVAGVAPALGAVAHAARVTLAHEVAPTPVAAWNETVMWSRFDPATETYSLVKSVAGGPPVPVGVAPRPLAPFDIDLGTNRSGATYAVYTREDGDIYRLHVVTGTESKVEELSTPTRVESDPTIHRGEIAFVRHTARGHELRIGNSARGSKGSRLLVRANGILGVELGTRHVAYLRAVPAIFSDERVHVRNLRTGADRMVYKAVSGGANAAGVTRPTFVAGPAGFLWARTNQGSETGNRIVRYTLRGSKLAYAQGSPYYNSTAWAGGALGVATASMSDTDYGEPLANCLYNASTPFRDVCPVQITGPLRFDLRP